MNPRALQKKNILRVLEATRFLLLADSDDTAAVLLRKSAARFAERPELAGGAVCEAINSASQRKRPIKGR